MDQFNPAEWPQTSDYNELLKALQSEDIMFQLEGVTQMRNSLSVANEETLRRFPLESSCARLIELVKQEPIMDISNDIKYSAIQCLISIMDIFPTHIGTMVGQGLVTALRDALEQSMGFFELTEQIIKALEKCSHESPKAVLHSGALSNLLNTFDFFDNTIRTKILTALYNVIGHSDNEDDFNKNVVPMLPTLCNFLSASASTGPESDQDRQKAERITSILLKVVDNITQSLSPSDNFNLIGEQYNKLSNAGVHEVLMDCLQTYSTHVSFTSAQNASPELKNQQSNSSKSSFSESMMSSALRILRVSAIYSEQVYMQLLLGNIFEVLQPMLNLDSDDERCSLLSDVMALLDNLLPSQPEDRPEEVSYSSTKSFYFDEADKSRYNLFLKARESREAEKVEFLKSQDKTVLQAIVKQTIPSIFKAFGQNIQSTFRMHCLRSLEKILKVVPEDLVQEHLNPNGFTEFLQVILRTHQPQQVLCCLKIVSKLLESKFRVALHFLRHGISEVIAEYTKPETIEKINNYEPPVQKIPQDQNSDSMKSIFFSMQASQERDRLKARLDRLKELSTNLTGDKKEVVNRDIAQYEDALKILNEKTKILEERFGFSIGEKQEKPDKIKHLFGDKIAELAKELRQKYFDNKEFWEDIKQSNPQMLELMSRLKKISDSLLKEAQDASFDSNTTDKNLMELIEILCSDLGITSFEFEHSGLLKAIRIYLTMSASQASSQSVTFDNISEERKENSIQINNIGVKEISKREARCLILRLRAFTLKLLKTVNGKKPFHCLLKQLQDQVTLSEPLIFKDSAIQGTDYNGQMDALRQLCKHVVINLVYDPKLAEDKDKDDDENAEFPQIDLRRAKSTPFAAALQAPQKQKSLLYLKRNDLYTKLESIPLNIQQCDNVWLLEDFLLKRVKTKKDVDKLIAQTRRPHAFFKSTANEKTTEAEKEKFTPEQKDLFDAIRYIILTFVDTCEDQETFRVRHVEITGQCVQSIFDRVKESQDNNQNLVIPSSFYRLLQEVVAHEIKQSHLDEDLGEGGHGEEGSDSEMQLDLDAYGSIQKKHMLQAIVAAKTGSFMEMIDRVSEQATQKLKSLPNKVPKKAEVTAEAAKEDEEMKEEPLQSNVQQLQMQVMVQGDNDDVPHPQNDEDEDMEEDQEDQIEGDVEMTEEQLEFDLVQKATGAQEMPDESQELQEEMSDDLLSLSHGAGNALNKSPPAKSTSQLIKQIKADQPVTVKSEQDDESAVAQLEDLQIDDLLKLSNDEDIEVQFFVNSNPIPSNMSIYEIYKETEAKLKEDQPKNSKDLLSQMSLGLYPGSRTIKFCIRDKQSLQSEPGLPSKMGQLSKNQRADSLQEYSKIRERTKSQFVDEINAANINQVVQSLIDENFSIKDTTQSGNSKQDASLQQQDDNQNTLQSSEQASLEYALQILKVMHYICNQSEMLTSEGLSLLLLKSSQASLATSSANQNLNDLSASQGSNDQMLAEDFEIRQISQMVTPHMFYHSKLDLNLQKAIQDPYQLVSGGISPTLRQIFNQCSFLFPFETKQIYFRLVSFIGVDIYRSLHFLKGHLKRNHKLPIGNASNKGSIFNEKEAKIPAIGKQKIKIDRNKILEESFSIMKVLQKRTLLEIEYNGEEGTGLGPTLEFYSILAKFIRADETLWRKDTPEGFLYPKPLLQGTSDQASEVQKTICEKFQMMGLFVAKSICDNRMIDLPLSPVMWDLLLGKKQNLHDLKLVDVNLHKYLTRLQVMANRKREIDDMQGIEDEVRKRLLAGVKDKDGCTVDQYDFWFHDPVGGEEIELVKGGSQIQVTLSNVQQYIDLVLDSTFNFSLQAQLSSFKKGFCMLLPIDTLRIFQQKVSVGVKGIPGQSEIEHLVCGIEGDDAEWKSHQQLQEVIVTDHGYNRQSEPFKFLLRYMNELEQASGQRAKFLRFITGSPRLPIGGFAGLEPRLTIVLKKSTDPKIGPDNLLPSVMTCQNYVKMPAYSSFEVLKAKFDTAINEGVGSFALS